MKSTYCLQVIFLVTVLSCAMMADDVPDETDDDLVIDLSAYGTRLYGVPQKSAGEALQKWQRAEKAQTKKSEVRSNPEEVGPYVEGDILVPSSTGAGGRNGMVAESYRWRDAIVPFEITGSFDARTMDLIEKAITAYHENTCIKFTPRSHTDLDYVSIQSTSTGCWSSVGRTGGRQIVNLQSPGCTTKVGTIMHELMHAIGFLHEQNREERDDFVVVQLENVRKGYEINFAKAAAGTASGFGVGYDYGSVMHYSEGAFSVNEQPTIKTKVNNKSNEQSNKMKV